MGDQDQQAVQTPEEAPVESQETTRPVSEQPEQAHEEPQEDQQPNSSHEDEEGGEHTEEKKSRLERRVDKLVSKLKEQSQPGPSQEAYSQIFGSNEPLITPEDMETGIDPQVLEQRLEHKRLQDRELIKQELRAEGEYKSTISEHVADIDAVQKELGENPELDKLVAQQYEALNYQTDPRTGVRIFVPQVKMSDIFQNFKKILDKTSTQAAADVTGRVVAQAGQQAVPPSVVSSPTKDLETQALYDRAVESGTDEDWAAVLKKRIK